LHNALEEIVLLKKQIKKKQKNKVVKRIGNKPTRFEVNASKRKRKQNLNRVCSLTE